MANYVKTVDFASKDALPSGDINKAVRGTELDGEFEAIETAVNSKADLLSPAFTGAPTAPTAPVNSSSTQVATTAFVRSVVPAGIVSMWSGSVANIPSGWLLCDGSNSTPDLRNRFVIGAGSTYGVGASGGSKDAVVVDHTHTTTVTDPGHSHNVTSLDPEPGGGVSSWQGGSDALSATNSTTTSATGITVGIANAGVSGTDANLPPYYALCYIMKT